MVREMNAALVPTATYLSSVRGPEYRRDDTQTETDGQGHTFGKTRWYVYDGLGSVVGEVDPLGNETCSNGYDVYGNVRSRTGTASTSHGFVGSLGHTSDSSTGLIYMRARYYDPGTGRFVSEDPANNGENWFAYCNSNPINKTDTSGKAANWVNLIAEIGWDVFKKLMYHNNIIPSAPGVDSLQIIREQLVEEINGGARSVVDRARGLIKGEAEEEGTDGIDVADEAAAGGGMIGEAQNLATDIEDLSILDELEGEGNDGAQ